MSINDIRVSADDLDAIEAAWGKQPQDNQIIGIVSVYVTGIQAGLERAAAYFDDASVQGNHTATVIRTLKDGGTPCEDCGYPLPAHDPSCVSRNI